MIPILVLLAAAPAKAQVDTATDEVAVDPAAIAPTDRWAEEPGIVFDASETTLDDWRFIARPIVVFADSPNDPRFIEQMELLTAGTSDLIARDVVLIVDTSPADRSAIRQELRPRGFALVVIGKDGRIAQRKPAPWDVREIGRAIDKLPLRQQEIRDGA